MRRLKNTTQKIAIAGVTAAIAFVCVLIGRFSPVGGLFLMVVAGTMTLLCTRICGLGYGILGYAATALLSILALPFGFIYIILCGPLAVLRAPLFGKEPRKKSRTAVGYAVIVPIGYLVCVGLTYLVGAALHMTDFVAALGGPFVFALIADAVVVIYDVAVGYLSGELAKVLVKSRRKKKTDAREASASDDPFAPYRAEQGSGEAIPSVTEAERADGVETQGVIVEARQSDNERGADSPSERDGTARGKLPVDKTSGEHGDKKYPKDGE